jgi:hypothetical protein
MSAAVRAALAARRAAAKLSSSKPTDDDILVQPFGTPKKDREDSEVGQSSTGLDEPLESSDLWISQRGEGELLFKSCWTGKLNLSSRQPAFRTLPLSLFTLLDADAPQWYEDGSEKVGERRAWYERQDLQTLAVANGDLEEVDARLAEFASLNRLDVSLHGVALVIGAKTAEVSLPPAASQQPINIAAVIVLSISQSDYSQSIAERLCFIPDVSLFSGLLDRARPLL